MSQEPNQEKSSLDRWLPLIFLGAFSITCIVLTLVSYLSGASKGVCLFFAVASLILVVLTAACAFVSASHPNLKDTKSLYNRRGWSEIRARELEPLSLTDRPSATLKVANGSGRTPKGGSGSHHRSVLH